MAKLEYDPAKALDENGDLFEPYTYGIHDDEDLCNVCGGYGWLAAEAPPHEVEVCHNCNGDSAVKIGSRYNSNDSSGN